MRSYRLSIQCPKCGAEPEARCRAASGRTTDVHIAREDAYYNMARDRALKRHEEERQAERRAADEAR